MRIASLLPAATEIVAALGLGDDLVATTHACTPPPGARPQVVTRRTPIGRARGTARHLRAQAEVHAGADAFELDLDTLAALAPDVVLVQERCPACGRVYRPMSDALRERLGRGVSIVSLEPASIDGILHAVATVGAMTSAEDEAVGLVELLRERLADVEEGVAARHDAGHRAPRVVALDWLDPPAVAGHWVPEQVRRAGGWDVLGQEGGPVRETSWAAIEELDPEVILLMPCGTDRAGAVAAWDRVHGRRGPTRVRAVRHGHVFAVDAVGYFDRPAPAAIAGIELLAELLDPDGFVDIGPADAWVPVG